jgi:hypothetical protein
MLTGSAVIVSAAFENIGEIEMNNNRACQSCGNPASRWTVFGMNIGNYCSRCYRDINQRMMAVARPFQRAITDSFQAFTEEIEAVDPDCEPIEYQKTCPKCGDKLTGHEDEDGTHCRWCMTCHEVTEGESIAIATDAAE